MPVPRSTASCRRHGGRGMADLGKLKEQWGVSMQALLFRARQLGRLGDVSYRNAMTTISPVAGGVMNPDSSTPSSNLRYYPRQ